MWIGVTQAGYSFKEELPIERLWRDLKDQLAGNLPHTLDELFERVAQIITRYSTNALRSLTAFSYLIEAITSANVYQS